MSEAKQCGPPSALSSPDRQPTLLSQQIALLVHPTALAPRISVIRWMTKPEVLNLTADLGRQRAGEKERPDGFPIDFGRHRVGQHGSSREAAPRPASGRRTRLPSTLDAADPSDRARDEEGAAATDQGLRALGRLGLAGRTGFHLILTGLTARMAALGGSGGQANASSNSRRRPPSSSPSRPDERSSSRWGSS